MLVSVWPYLSGFGNFPGLIVAAVLASAVYGGLLLALGVPEIRAVFALIRARLPG
jgi:hypothetical protein